MSSITPPDIIAKLEELAEVRAAVDLTRLDYEAQREEILKGLKAELEALAAEYEPLLASASERATMLETEIKQAVVAAGASIKASRLQAVYTRGRVSWDNKRLESYAFTHPEVLAFRKESEPSVSLRIVK